MKQICILCAVPPEVSAFKQLFEFEKPTKLGAMLCWVGRYEDTTVSLIQTGVGKVQAAAAAQLAIMHYSPDAMFSCGTAGSLDDRCDIGDIIIGKTTIQHDYGFILPDAFVHFGIHLSKNNGKKGFFQEFQANKGLFKATETVRQHLKGQVGQIFSGPILTGDQIIFSSEKRRELAEQFNALAVDMESAAIAQVCTVNRVPFLAIRGISDHADEQIQIDISKLDPNEFGAYPLASFNEKLRLLTKAFQYFSHHPSAFMLSIQAQQQMKIAAKSSAVFTLELLKTL